MVAQEILAPVALAIMESLPCKALRLAPTTAALPILAQLKLVTMALMQIHLELKFATMVAPLEPAPLPLATMEFQPCQEPKFVRLTILAQP